jgi:hypothetical protein
MALAHAFHVEDATIQCEKAKHGLQDVAIRALLMRLRFLLLDSS